MKPSQKQQTMSKPKSTVVLMVLAALAGILTSCAFHEPSKAPVKESATEKQTTPETAKTEKQTIPEAAKKNAIQVQFRYDDQSSQPTEFAWNEKSPVWENDVPVTVPAKIPDRLFLKFASPNWKSMSVSAFAVFGSEIRELKADVSPQQDNTLSEAENNEVILGGLASAFPAGNGRVGKIAVELKSEQEKISFVLHLRTPPEVQALKEDDLPDSVKEPIALSPTLVAIPLRRYEIANGSQWNWRVELPQFPTGRFLQRIRRTSFSQGGCAITQTTGIEESTFSDRLILVPEGTGQSQTLKLLSDKPDAKVNQLVPSTGVAAFMLYGIYSTQAPDPRQLGRNWTGAAKMLSPACAPAACSVKQGYVRWFNWSGGDCSGGWWQKPDERPIRDGLYCKQPYRAGCDRAGNCDMKGKPSNEIEFGSCLDFFIDPLTPIAQFDYTEILGTHLEAGGLSGSATVGFEDDQLPRVERRTVLPPVLGRVRLWGE